MGHLKNKYKKQARTWCMLVMNEYIKRNLSQLEVRKQTYKLKLGITFLKEAKTYLGETNAFFATLRN